MKIRLPNEKDRLVLDDVKMNQMFISKGGYLCQKNSYETCQIIANESGELFTANMSKPNIEVKAIVPFFKFDLSEYNDKD